MGLSEIGDRLEALDDRTYAEALQDWLASGADGGSEASACEGVGS